MAYQLLIDTAADWTVSYGVKTENKLKSSFLKYYLFIEIIFSCDGNGDVIYETWTRTLDLLSSPELSMTDLLITSSGRSSVSMQVFNRTKPQISSQV